MKRALITAALLVAAACSKPAPPPPQPTRTATPSTTAPGTTATSGGAEHVTFANVEGWQKTACSDVRPEDGCDSQWLHDSGQVVRVFFVPVKDERALSTFVDKLAQDVASKNGVVDRFTQNGLTLVRFLQEVRGDKGERLASINYALVGRDHLAVHLVTSVVDFEQQRPADERLRALLDSAAWSTPPAPGPSTSPLTSTAKP